MSLDDEQPRAVAYRASLAAREAFLTDLQERVLAGDDAAAQAVKDAWSPVRRGLGVHPVDPDVDLEV